MPISPAMPKLPVATSAHPARAPAKGSPPFSLRNYWRMYRARGLRHIVMYFRESHWFDLRHGVDTHNWLPLDHYGDEVPDTFAHGVQYMCSWTSEVRRIFAVTRQLLGAEFERHAFLDVGCGKGKVAIIWAQECRRLGLRQAICGIEYHEPLLKAARSNAVKALGEAAQFVHADATQYDFAAHGQPLILYLYNPFDEVVLQRMLQRLQGVQATIIYNYPVHDAVLRAQGWQVVSAHRGTHANQHTLIYQRKA